jgi:hypothetical protein
MEVRQERTKVSLKNRYHDHAYHIVLVYGINVIVMGSPNLLTNDNELWFVLTANS